jgi:hypothetical protein
MEGCYTARPQVTCKPAQRGYGIWIVHQHNATDYGVKGLSECGLKRITFLEGNVPQRIGLGPRPRHIQSCLRPIDPYDLPSVPDEVCRQKRYVPGTEIPSPVPTMIILTARPRSCRMSLCGCAGEGLSRALLRALPP